MTIVRHAAIRLASEVSISARSSSPNSAISASMRAHTATTLAPNRIIGWRSWANAPSEDTTSTSRHSSANEASTRTMRGSEARAAASARRSSAIFSAPASSSDERSMG